MKPTTKRDVYKSYRISIGEEGAIILRFSDALAICEPLIFASYAEAPGWVRDAMKNRPGNRHGDYFIAPMVWQNKHLAIERLIERFESSCNKMNKPDELTKIKALLTDSLFDGSKDWREGSVVDRIEWILITIKNLKSEVERLEEIWTT